MRPLLLASGGPRRIARPASILSLTLGLLLSACASNRNVSQTTPQQEPPAQSSPSEITAEPTTPQQPTATEPSIGEQLGRLDALMRTATGDSLARLREEYDRLLQRANGGIIQTGGTSQTTMAEPAQPEGATPQLKGLRPSELRFADGEGTATPATPATPRRPTSRPEQAKATTRATDRSDEVEIPREPSKNATLAQRQKKLVDGLAATRAGDYQKATQDLPKALSTPVNGARRTEAEYSYGLALEKTGNLSKAAETYLKASSADESLGHKSYVAYCRVLARSGQRKKARQLLVEFIQKHPKSSQVVSARQLLQTI